MPICIQHPTLVISVPPPLSTGTELDCDIRYSDRRLLHVYEYIFADEKTYFKIDDEVSWNNAVLQHLIEHRPQLHPILHTYTHRRHTRETTRGFSIALSIQKNISITYVCLLLSPRPSPHNTHSVRTTPWAGFPQFLPIIILPLYLLQLC